MTKYFSYYLTNDLFDIVSEPIRSKNDVVNVMLNCLKVMLSDVEVEDQGLGKFEVNVNKMSRMVFSPSNDQGLNKKRFSFSFPFYISGINNKVETIELLHSKIPINSTLINILLRLSEEGVFDEKAEETDLVDILDKLLESIEFYGVMGSEIEKVVWTTSKEFFLFEPGYIRYDLDDTEGRVNPTTHPLHHLDVYYSSHLTFKVGITDLLRGEHALSCERFIDILDVTTPCYNLHREIGRR